MECEAILTQTTCSAPEQHLLLSELRRSGWISQVHSGEQQHFEFDFFLAQLSTLMFGAELDQLLTPLHFIFTFMSSESVVVQLLSHVQLL